MTSRYLGVSHSGHLPQAVRFDLCFHVDQNRASAFKDRRGGVVMIGGVVILAAGCCPAPSPGSACRAA